MNTIYDRVLAILTLWGIGVIFVLVVYLYRSLKDRIGQKPDKKPKTDEEVNMWMVNNDPDWHRRHLVDL